MSIHRQLFFNHLGLPSMKPMGLEIVRAEGIYFFDRDGKKYIDLVSGVAVSNLGHRHPEVVAAIKEQLDAYLHLMVYGEFIQSPQVLLAKALTAQLPNELDHVYFVNSGSEAIDGAIKLAKRHTGRTEVAAFRYAYHGGTYGALSILGEERLKNAFRPLVPDTRSLPFNELDALEHITERTACVVAETVQAEAGIIPASDDFMKALRRRCTEMGTLLVIDDIQMGMGRTGKLFSFEHYAIVPDILVLAKAFGGGMPLGAFIAPGETMKSLTFNPELGHITTFGGHPVSCAAALASLEVLLRDKPYLQSEKIAGQFIRQIQGHPMVSTIRHKGLMIAVELEDATRCKQMMELLLQNGVVVDAFLFRPQAFRIGPPLTISEPEVNEAATIILSCLDKLR